MCSQMPSSSGVGWDQQYDANYLLTSNSQLYNERMTDCPVCHKTFHFPSKLKEHILTHTDERQFVCTLCPCAFKRKHHLRRHVLIRHPN